MICKFRADTVHPTSSPFGAVSPYRRAGLALAAACLCCSSALAEKADRAKPMSVEADQPGSVDLQRQVVVFNGNVVITQGTMVIRAARIELRERPDGYRAATAVGTAETPASFRQKRDGVDETVEAAAERIEYDGRTDMLRFVGNAAVRRLRGTAVADEINGALITWDNTRELFSVSGGSSSPANPSGRVRAVFAPPGEPAASAPAAASAAESHAPKVSRPHKAASAPAGIGETLLKPSPTLVVPR